jgi:acetyl esterase
MPIDLRLSLLIQIAKLRPDDLSVPMAAAIGHVSVPVAGGRIRVRLYRPHGAGPFPLYVFLHGGGFCMGTLDEREQRCRAVSAGARCVVASVDYRLAPENQYPTPPEDCYAALEWLVEHAGRLDVDPARVAIGGESAGANLAAVACLMSRDRNGPRLVHQWLDVPTTDATCSQSGFREVPDGYLLDRAAIDDYLEHYLAHPAQASEPWCSPLLADDHRGLPPAWIMTAEYDKLRGDGAAYASALAAAGVPVTHVRLDGHIHPSFAFTRLLPSARAYQDQAIAALRSAFEG